MRHTSSPERPASVPADAWWSEQDGEWVAGPRDETGQLHALVRYFRPTGTLVSETEHSHGKPHGACRRFHDNGEIAQTATYVEGKLHGVRAFFPCSGETSESPLPGGKCTYDQGDLIGTTYRDREGRRVTEQGQLIPVAPAGLPATACWFPATGEWLFMRRQGEDGTPTLITRMWYADGKPKSESLRNEDGSLQEREWHEGGALSEEGRRVPFQSKLPRHGTWRFYDKDGHLRRCSEFDQGQETQRTWQLRPEEGTLVRSGPIVDGKEAGMWEVRSPEGRLLEEVRLGEFLSDEALLSTAVMQASWRPEEEPEGVLGLCARVRLAARQSSTEVLQRSLGARRPWMARTCEDGQRDWLVREDTPSLTEIMQGLVWGAEPSPPLHHLSKLFFAQGRPALALDFVDAALCFGRQSSWIDSRALYLLELGRTEEAEVCLQESRPDRMTDVEEALLRAVAAAPEHDAPRLAYAEWVEGRDPQRARLIRVGCELARIPEQDPARAVLLTEHQALAAAQQARLARLSGHLARSEFQRGFLMGTYAYMDIADFLLHADDLYRVLPGDRLSIGPGEGLERLVRMPALSRYRYLNFPDGYLPDPRAGWLAACPYLEGLRSLAVYGVCLEDDGLSALAASPYLRQLTSLQIGGKDNDFGLTGFQSLAQATFASTLEELHCGRRYLHDGLVEVLAHLPRLRVLDLDWNCLEDEGAIQLAGLDLPLLEELHLKGSDFDVDGARALAAAPLLGGLRTLTLGGSLSSEALCMLVTSPRIGNLRHLEMDGRSGHPDASVARALAEAPHLKDLVRLELSLGQIGPEGAQALAGAGLRKLTHLNLHNNRVGVAGARAIAGAPSLAALQGLDIGGNDIGDAGAMALVESPHLEALRWLQVGATQLSPRAQEALQQRFGKALQLTYSWER